MTRTAFDHMEARRLYDIGYSTGYRHGELQTRLTDEAFIDAVARRVRAGEYFEGQISSVIRGTIDALNARAARDRMTAEAEARGDSRKRGARR